KYFHFDESGIKNYQSRSDIFTSWIEDFRNNSEQGLLGSFRKTLRHEVRDAQNENLTVKKCENPKELKQFYNLYVASLKRKKTVPYPFSIIEFLDKDRNNEILLASKNNKIIAGDLFLNYGNFVHYFLNASNYRYKDLGTNYLLLWNKIKSLIGQDKILDLGATPKGSSLDIFKRGWGGKEYPIVQIGIKKNSEGLRSSKLRNIWGLLPNFIIKGLSSRLIKYRL
ncbi:MAG: peptidoglycan bridge formation glycyltransferase FemA/FemB family protein, partial [bacterium]|nr:peptidoglycan bridge formation glycyltransferase FemA/FemB family protein [bacterium]